MVNTRLSELDSLRGLAALILVLAHVPNWNAQVKQAISLPSAHLMVELFFVLSGLILHQLYATKLLTPGDLVRFLALRLGRVYPLHLCVLLMYLLLELARWRVGHVGAAGPAFSINTWAAFAQQMTLTQTWGAGNDLTFNAAAWSISAELAAYIGFAVLCLAVPARWLTLAFVGVLAAAAWGLVAYLPAFDSLLRCAAGFATGCLLSVVLGRASLPGWVGPSGAALLLTFLVFRPHGREWGIYLLVFPLSALVALSAVASPAGCAWRRVLRCPPLVWLGEISYSVYMVSLLVILAVDRTARAAGLLPAAEGANGVGISAALAALTVCATLALAAVTYRWIEVPARCYVRSLIR